jgi:hypothetical protein
VTSKINGWNLNKEGFNKKENIYFIENIDLIDINNEFNGYMLMNIIQNIL